MINWPIYKGPCHILAPQKTGTASKTRTIDGLKGGNNKLERLRVKFI